MIPRITRRQKLIRGAVKIQITHSSSSAFGTCSKLILATDSFISSFVCTKANLCTGKPAANAAVCYIYSPDTKNFSFVCVCVIPTERLCKLDRANRPYKQWRLSSFNVVSLPDLFQNQPLTRPCDVCSPGVFHWRDRCVCVRHRVPALVLLCAWVKKTKQCSFLAAVCIHMGNSRSKVAPAAEQYCLSTLALPSFIYLFDFLPI